MRSRWKAPVLLVLMVAAACAEPPPAPPPDPPAVTCGSGSRPSEGGACEAVLPPATCGPRELTWGGEDRCHAVEGFGCPAGTAAEPDGWGCEPILAADCPPGTRPSLGSTACAPVGWNHCPDGFARDLSGWGCRGIVAERCTGATRPELGRSACVELGDCGAPFPPAGALLVDDSFADAALDASHFRSIQAALDAAPDGATVAIEAGTYLEALSVTRAVQLVGRCAGQVKLVAPATGKSGVKVAGAFEVRLEGLHFSGFHQALDLKSGARLVAEALLVEDSGNAGARCVDAGSELQLRRSVVRDSHLTAAGFGGLGVWATAGCHATVEDSLLDGHEGAGITAEGPSSAVTVRRSVIARNGARRATPAFAGFWLLDGASGEVHQTVFLENRAGIFASTSGGLVVVRDSEFRSAVVPPEGFAGAIMSNGSDLDVENVRIEGHTAIAIGTTQPQTSAVRNAIITGTAALRAADTAVGAARGASLEVSDSVVFDNATYGLRALDGAQLRGRGLLLASNGSARSSGSVFANSGGLLTLEDAFITTSRGVGVDADGEGTSIELDRVVVESSLYLSDAFLSAAINATSSAKTVVKRSVLRDNTDVGIAVDGAELLLQESLIQRSSTVREGPLGNAVLAVGASTVRLERSQLAASRVAGLRALPGTHLELQDVVVLGDTLGRPEYLGLGIAAFGQLRAERVAVIGTDLTGIHLSTGSGASLDQVRISGTRPSDGEHGHGLVAIDCALRLTRSQLDSNSAVGALFSGATADVLGCALSRNPIGAHAQLGSSFVPGSGDAKPGEVRIGPDTLFLENTARLGSGVVPLPTVRAD